MVRRMCGVRLSDKKRSEDLRSKLGILDIEVVLRRSRLRWYMATFSGGTIRTGFRGRSNGKWRDEGLLGDLGKRGSRQSPKICELCISMHPSSRKEKSGRRK